MSLRVIGCLVGACAIFIGITSATATRAPAADPEQLECLALNVYWEARSEPKLGQEAVAHLTLNRVRAPDFPDDICDVVNQGVDRGRNRCQFSWNCDGAADVPQEPEAWRTALRYAKEALAEPWQDPTGGALYFHLASIRPAWAKRMHLTRKIGNHFFYR
jgi:N-acetylmuramoyl-L-alanine amidase